MPICGYLVYPMAGKSDALIQTLGAIPECDVKKSDNRDVMILVTDTADDVHEERLQKRLKSIKSIRCLAMTFGAMEGAVPGAVQDVPVSGRYAHLESPQEEKKS